MSQSMTRLREARELLQQGRPDAARVLCEVVLEADARNVDALYLLGVIASQAHDSASALQFFDRVLAFDSAHTMAHFSRGYVLQALRQLAPALQSYAKAIALKPDFAPAHSNRGAALYALNRCGEALPSLERAIALEPNNAEAHFCRAILWLMCGDYARGWEEYEWRWHTVSGRILRRTKCYAAPLWLGAEPVAGQTVLLYCERGLGDTLQFCRYAQQLLDLEARVILQVQAPLVSLLRCLPQGITVIGEADPAPACDWQCPLLSLPWAFKTSLGTIPAPARYLRADAARIARQRSGMSVKNGPRVGLVWRGDPDNPDDRQRSMALSELLQQLPAGVQYVGLQKETSRTEAGVLRDNPHLSLVNDGLDFEETAALCECLDLVISIDSSVAHLAAALGRPTWILLPFNPDCRWLMDRADSPWYPSVKLYRQSTAGDWPAVLTLVRADLIRWLA